jgi:glycosyltransferase involved in cell wall biosynthesis
MAEVRTPKILVLNQYYWPGVEATAHLLAELCAGLTDEFEITVVSGRMGDPSGGENRITHRGVEIVRVPSTTYERSKLSRRALNYFTYLASSVGVALSQEKPDVVLCMTDPPIIADVAYLAARRFGVPLVVISQDVFPEAAVELGRLTNPLIVGFLRRAIRYYLRRADRVVAIGETMRMKLEAKGADPARLRVISNWVDTTAIQPEPQDNEWSRENDLAGKFVVMHSGNVGYAQNLDAVIRAATFLRDLEDTRIVIVGAGARHAELVQLTARLEADLVTFLPYQPREMLSHSLSAATVHVVGLAEGLAGYVVPSRLYGIMAAGRPVIVAAQASSETAQVVEREGCGVVVPPGRPDALAAVIREMRDGVYDLEEMGRRGRAFVEREADRTVAIERYRTVLREVIAEAKP